jgi:hypothetical protein
VVLASRTPRGAHQVIDSLHYGAQKADRALARIGCGGSWGSAAPTPAAPNTPLAGDVNLSGDVNITDPIVILNHLFLGGSIACRGAADANGDGRMDLSDASYLLNFLFLGGPAASPPAGCE